ncbi:hypothetical protein BD779DRAFT_1474749 [Infundibulicybe gibba]|nr:hypothetical protein BD779DRAFT_1474749 [Infundibulicybe gibba]
MVHDQANCVYWYPGASYSKRGAPAIRAWVTPRSPGWSVDQRKTKPPDVNCRIMISPVSNPNARVASIQVLEIRSCRDPRPARHITLAPAGASACQHNQSRRAGISKLGDANATRWEWARLAFILRHRYTDRTQINPPPNLARKPLQALYPLRAVMTLLSSEYGKRNDASRASETSGQVLDALNGITHETSRLL